MTIQKAVAFAIIELVLFGIGYCFKTDILEIAGTICACLFVKRIFYPTDTEENVDDY
ncbi:hypothetical protein [Komagataeibacter xylinus]|uniref:hypothetical protein n=1 Tax=Komagataeibacter xylinus TaxID=28448 RepID=UPI00280B1767|nr:hypothetical protein [Komagataeibacter xylinus]